MRTQILSMAALVVLTVVGSAQAQNVQPLSQSMWFLEVTIGQPDQTASLSMVNGEQYGQCFLITFFRDLTTAPFQQVWCMPALRRDVFPLHYYLAPGQYGVLVQAFGLVGSSISQRPTGDPDGARARILIPDRQDTPLVLPPQF